MMHGSFHHMPVLITIAVSLAMSGCSRRERINPLDPLNPDTAGKPGGLSVISINEDVMLSWDLVDFEGIDAFRVYRRMESENDYSRIAVLPEGAIGYTDEGRAYDVQLTYRISIVSGDYESPLSDSVSIIPGPHTYWILDYYGSSVSRWTYDAGHLISNRGMDLWPKAMALDKASEAVWVMFVQSYLLRLSYEGEYLNWIEDFNRPVAIGFNPSNGSVWVADEEGTQLRRFSTSGLEMGRVSGFGEISDISCPRTGGCWVTDKKNSSLLRYHNNGMLDDQFTNVFQNPGRVAFFEPGSWLWIADSLKLFRFSPEGEVLIVTGTEQPIEDIDVDNEGNCWAVVNDPVTWEGSLLKISPAGDLMLKKGNLLHALSVASVPHNNGCLVADTGNGRILRFSENGDILHILDGFPSPWQILVD